MRVLLQDAGILDQDVTSSAMDEAVPSRHVIVLAKDAAGPRGRSGAALAGVHNLPADARGRRDSRGVRPAGLERSTAEKARPRAPMSC